MQMQEQCRQVLQQTMDQERSANALSVLGAQRVEALLANIQQQAENFIPK